MTERFLGARDTPGSATFSHFYNALAADMQAKDYFFENIWYFPENKKKKRGVGGGRKWKTNQNI